jgi:hypothetical protein
MAGKRTGVVLIRQAEFTVSKLILSLALDEKGSTFKKMAFGLCDGSIDNVGRDHP